MKINIKIIFLIIIGFIALLLLQNPVQANLGEGVSVDITANPSTETLVKKGEIITYTITLKNDSDVGYAFPMLAMNFQEGIKYIELITNDMNPIIKESLDSVMCMIEKIEPKSEVKYELKVKVLGNTDEIILPEIFYILLKEDITDEEMQEIFESEEYENAETMEELKKAFEEKGYINLIITEEKHLLDKEDLANEPEIGTGVTVNISSDIPKGTKLKRGDIITYTVTIKNDSDREYGYINLWCFIPDGTIFESITESGKEEEILPLWLDAGIEKRTEKAYELKLKITGTAEEISTVNITCELFDLSQTLDDVFDFMMSEQYLMAVTIDEKQEAFGDKGYIVQVSSKEEYNADVVIFSDNYNFEGSVIRDIDEKTIRDNFINNINNNTEEELKVFSQNNDGGYEEIESTDIVATGMIMYIGEGEAYTIIVTGDLSKDGKVSAVDLSNLRTYIVGLTELSEESVAASDINNDEKVSATDLSKLKRMVVGLE